MSYFMDPLVSSVWKKGNFGRNETHSWLFDEMITEQSYIYSEPNRVKNAIISKEYYFTGSVMKNYLQFYDRM